MSSDYKPTSSGYHPTLPDLGEITGRFGPGYHEITLELVTPPPPPIRQGPRPRPKEERWVAGKWDLHLSFRLKIDDALSARAIAQAVDFQMQQAVWNSKRTQRLLHGFAVSAFDLITYASTRPRGERLALLALVEEIRSGAVDRTVATTREKAAARAQALQDKHDKEKRGGDNEPELPLLPSSEN